MSKPRSKSKEHLRAMSTSRRHRARSTRRVIKYGTASFARNLWLTIAATLVMTIALLVISVTLIARNIMTDTVNELKSTIEISVYLENKTDEPIVNQIAADIKALKSVADVHVTSPEEAKAEQIEDLREKTDNEDVVNAAIEAPNIFPWFVNVAMVDLSEMDELNEYIATDPTVTAHLDKKYEESDNRNERLEAIDRIASTTRLIETIGLIAGAVFAVIAALIIFNTIRMAIFNRREEIEMMKLIGASKGFIRGPFLVEAAFYGIISSAITGIIVWVALTILQHSLETYGLVITPTVELIVQYWWVVIPSILLVGVLIGMISAALAIRKYLKVK